MHFQLEQLLVAVYTSCFFCLCIDCKCAVVYVPCLLNDHVTFFTTSYIRNAYVKQTYRYL